MGTGATIAIAVVACAAIAAAAELDAPPAPRLAASAPAAHGLSWRPPPGWHDARRPLVEGADPSLAAATFRVPRRRPASICDPRAIPRLIPPRGALVLVQESLWAAGVRSRLRLSPPRPQRFRLPRRAVPLECTGVARAIAFRERQRAFGARVWLGSKAPRSRLREAEQLLDSLRVEPVPPPRREPWELWRELITEAGDTMHVPPGWAAGVLEVPRRLHRPRLLFYAATEPVPGWARGRRARLGSPRLPVVDGAAVWVTEHERGPVSDRYPSLRRDPFTERDTFHPFGERSWRARGAWRGYRFSVTVTAGDGATDEDLRRAFESASSLALSGGLRDCSRAAQERRPDLCAGAR